MRVELINIGLAFLEGFALIISPCILPILPIILSGSLEGGKKRPLGIIIGFVLVFALFTLFSKKLVELSGLDLNLIRNISFVLLLALGIVMISTYLTEKFSHLTQRLANVGSSFTVVNNPEGGFFSGILFGGLVGFIWTPCAGPILAAVIVQTVIQQTTLNSFLTLLSFGIGAAVPMLIIALLGRRILTQFSFFRNRASFFRKILGVIIIASVIFMIAGDWFVQAVNQAKRTANMQPVTPTIAFGTHNPGLSPNTWVLQGDWILMPTKIVSSKAHASIKIRFYAKQVSMVMDSQSHQPIHIKLTLNGEHLISTKGEDVINSGLVVTTHKTYHVVNRQYPSSGILEMTADEPGLILEKIQFEEE